MRCLAAENGTLHRNFQGYTTDSCKVLLGFGASAIGQLPQGFVQNATRIPDYESRIQGNRLATVRGCGIDEEDKRLGAIIESLMCNYRAPVDANDPRLSGLKEDGLIRRAGDGIEVVEEARPRVRPVAAPFDYNLKRYGAPHAAAV